MYKGCVCLSSMNIHGLRQGGILGPGFLIFIYCIFLKHTYFRWHLLKPQHLTLTMHTSNRTWCGLVVNGTLPYIDGRDTALGWRSAHSYDSLSLQYSPRTLYLPIVHLCMMIMEINIGNVRLTPVLSGKVNFNKNSMQIILRHIYQ